jgi:hypothetical protein
MLLKHLQEPLPNMTHIRPDIPLEINSVIQRATVKTPELRFEKVSALSNAFHNAVSGIPQSLSVAETKPNITKPLIPTMMPSTTEGRNRYAMLQNGNNQPTVLETHGRHDPCVGIRAAPIAEAMLALVLMDHALRHRAQNADVHLPVPAIPASDP